ncbi:DUF6883 domain-containing protein [Pseudorhodoferax sp. Leaf267]|uniref:DUF6883 domain-containing protein n=1 Tax=Pseudorhodoferax sp. Leaf267 TaxID=1736316 RepID=UPI0012E23E81|nr:DUF6883 domain-containing protein [Pseudorhodoferax sp. Leaf267]
MLLPAAEQAHIDPAKIRDYLLSHVHPVGRFKATVFLALGYRAEEWERLRDDLLALACETEAVPGQASAFGQKYEVSGSLHGPNVRVAKFICVWLVPIGGEAPRFITAFPG